MNPRTTGILAIIAVMLGGFVYFYELEGESGRQAAAENERRLHPDLEPAEIEAIQLETQDGIDARFERREGGWQLVEPDLTGASGEDGVPADAPGLEAMATALTTLVREGTIDSPEALEDYGLGGSAEVIRFDVAGDERGIRIGGATPVGGHRYAATLASDDVGYVESFRTNAFNRNLADLRERRFFRFDIAAVGGIDLSWPGAELALKRDAEGWAIVSPVESRADDSTLRDLLSNLSFLSASEFVDERNPEVERALAESELAVRLRMRADPAGQGEGAVANATREIRIGGEYAGGRIVQGPEGRLYSIPIEGLDDFEREIGSYRYRMVSEYPMTVARRVVFGFSRGDESTTVVDARLGEAGWSSEEPAIDPAKAAGVVRELSSLRADSIAADAMGPAELAAFGLEPPRVTIRIEGGADAGSLASIFLGRGDSERGIYAQREGDPAVYLLSPSVAETVPVSWNAFVVGFEADAADSDAADDAEEGDLDEASEPDESDLDAELLLDDLLEEGEMR